MNEIQGILSALLPSIGAVIAVYVNLQNEMTKVKSRVYNLETDRDEIKTLVKECIEGIHELKILLARKGL